VEQDIQRRSGSGPDIQLSKNEGRVRNGLLNVYIVVQAFRYKVRISAIDVLFSGYRKYLDLIFIYLPSMMISTGNLRFLKPTSIVDK
jgi:hypothetical protein